MKIYTKKGDTGETGLFGGHRVPKDDLRIRTYGTLDELNSILGWIRSELKDERSNEMDPRLHVLQNELFQLGSELATPRGKDCGIRLVDASSIERMEEEIDAMEAKLPPLKTFILPGGSKLASTIHLARSVSRRAERELVTLNRADPVRSEALRYMNRLSDYLFVCARYANFLLQVEDTPWIAPTR